MSKKIIITPMPIYDGRSIIQMMGFMENEICQTAIQNIDPVTRTCINKIFDDYSEIVAEYAKQTVKAQDEHQRN